MPLQINNCVSRRSILRSGLAMGVGSFLVGCAYRDRLEGGKRIVSAARVTPDRWALLSDMHVAGDLRLTHRGADMAALAGDAVAGVLSLDSRPTGVIVNGDCAFLTGQSADYQRFAEVCVKPVVDAGLPLHLALGNHDHRDRFRTALQQTAGDVSGDVAGGHCVSVVEGQHARLFLLDSLDRTNAMSGKIGEPQLAWLDAALAASADRPAIVVGHHPIGFGPFPATLTGSLRDGAELWTILKRNANVKAYFYGHTHRWDIGKRDGIHLVNLPTTAYLFEGWQPHGWVDAHIHPNGAELRLNPIGDTSKRRAESVRLRWA